METLWVLLLLISIVAGSYPQNEDNSKKPKAPIIDLGAYKTQGFVYTTESGFEANLYLGLPYAQPPVDEFRFEKPQPLQTSNNLVKALNYGFPCHPQVDESPEVNSSEDCLTLNVFTPAKIGANEKLPVMFYIHGGGFNFEFSECYHYSHFVPHFVSRDIVVVTIQYRLSHFGFLSTRDNVISPNLGLWDQNAALKFIKNNIHKFGGDPEQITVWGHSAGSASTHAHLISPHSRDLFKAAFQMAGSINAYWAVGDDVYDYSDMVVKQLGCENEHGEKVKKCLQKIPYKKFWDATKELHFKLMTPGLDFLYFNPIMDKDFFDGKSWEELTKESTPKPVYYGLDAAEGLIFTIDTGHRITSPYAARVGYKSEQRKYFSKRQFNNHLVNVHIDRDIMNRDIIADEILAFYDVKEDSDEATAGYNYDRYTEYITIFTLFFPSLLEYQENLRNGYTDQYMYIFNYTRPSEAGILGPEPPHGYEWLFTAGLNAYTADDTPFDETDKKITKTLVDSWVNFVKTGNPSIDGVDVPKLTKNAMPYIHFAADSVEVKRGYYERQYKFWVDLAEKYNLDPITNKVLPGKTEGKRARDEF